MSAGPGADPGCENMSAGPGTEAGCENMSAGPGADASCENMSTDSDLDENFIGADNEMPSADTKRESMDSMTLAELDRQEQGTWETDYSYEGEPGLLKNYIECKKNPGHKNFIPVGEFRMEDLPDGYCDKDTFDYIQSVSKLTVGVSHNFISPNRPDTFPGTKKGYPNHEHRNKNRVTIGTGWVDSVEIPMNARERCQCASCLASRVPEPLFARISIQTASHNVYDDKEAECTKCYLHFDSGVKLQECSSVVTLAGMKVKYGQINRDMCELIHFTHDLDLASQLQQELKIRRELSQNILDRTHQTCRMKRRPDSQGQQPLLFIVSHPHGASKRISLGRCTNIDMFSNENFQFVYTTSTCPGSSGAPVVMLHRHGLQFFYSQKTSLDFIEIHCGVYARDKTLNYSSVLQGYPSQELVTLETLLLNEGPWADNLCCVEGEEDCHKSYALCQMNPGHKNTYQVDEFSMDLLPPFYRKPSVLELIRVMSDLTVRVSVTYVSPDRPETVPGTNTPYPWSTCPGGHHIRLGTGWVSEVDIFKNDRFHATCDCQDCVDSPTPRTEFAHIYIDTATHLVYDQAEGEHTTCDLFYDSGEAPGVCAGAVTLTGMLTVFRNMDKEWSRLTHVTHDLGLAERIDRMMNVNDACRQAVEEYEYFNPMENGKKNGRSLARRQIPLHLVVSHPHGCAKRISLGYHGHPETAADVYTCTTCAGSSGAPTIQMGWECLYPYLE